MKACAGVLIAQVEPLRKCHPADLPTGRSPASLQGPQRYWPMVADAATGSWIVPARLDVALVPPIDLPLGGMDGESAKAAEIRKPVLGR